MTRGPERSRRLEDVVREVTDLASGGTTEVTVLGQTVNSYDGGTHDFADLLRAVGGIAGVRRLRFTSPYPTDFTEGVVAAMAETPAVCEHVHLPVQSGSSRVLKRMLRRYDRARYRSEEHTSELQSPCNLGCRLLLEKKNRITSIVLRPRSIRVSRCDASDLL